MTKKKKIGIVTLADGTNFGNRLQNYALQVTLERLGWKVETLRHPLYNIPKWKKFKVLVHGIIPFRQKIEHKKTLNFLIWNIIHISWSPMVADETADYEKIRERYKYFVAGSDQIWNPKFPWGTDPYMFLQFTHPKQRVAYAPSIGLDSEFGEPYRSKFKTMWQDWRALSCREYAGAKIMSDLLKADIPCVLDPTLLLSKNEWIHLTRFCFTPHKYIFLYLLGDLADEYKKYLNELVQRTGCKIVDVMNDKPYAACNPSRFVALIQRADWVVTDSYHACVFSTIFHRPFTFINRVGWGMNMNSRMETLVEKLQISVPQWKNITEIVPLDWRKIDNAILAEQWLATNYLKNALK